MQGNVVHDILAMIAVEALRAHDVVGIQSGKNFFPGYMDVYQDSKFYY